MTSKKLPAARAEEPVMRFDEKGAELRDRLRTPSRVGKGDGRGLVTPHYGLGLGDFQP